MRPRDVHRFQAAVARLRPEKGTRGLSLLEVMVAIVLLVTTLLIVIGTLTTVLGSLQKSTDSTGGALIARSVLENRLAEILSDPVTRVNFFDAADGQLETGTGASLDNVKYEYTIYSYEVRLASGPLSPGNRLKQARIVVWWWGDEADTARAGSGRLRSDSLQLVNETSRG